MSIISGLEGILPSSHNDTDIGELIAGVVLDDTSINKLQSLSDKIESHYEALESLFYLREQVATKSISVSEIEIIDQSSILTNVVSDVENNNVIAAIEGVTDVIKKVFEHIKKFIKDMIKLIKSIFKKITMNHKKVKKAIDKYIDIIDNISKVDTEKLKFNPGKTLKISEDGLILALRFIGEYVNLSYTHYEILTQREYADTDDSKSLGEAIDEFVYSRFFEKYSKDEVKKFGEIKHREGHLSTGSTFLKKSVKYDLVDVIIDTSTKTITMSNSNSDDIISGGKAILEGMKLLLDDIASNMRSIEANMIFAESNIKDAERAFWDAEKRRSVSEYISDRTQGDEELETEVAYIQLAGATIYSKRMSSMSKAVSRLNRAALQQAVFVVKQAMSIEAHAIDV